MREENYETMSLGQNIERRKFSNHVPGPKYRQEVDSTDGRSQVAGDRLDIVEQLTALASL